MAKTEILVKEDDYVNDLLFRMWKRNLFRSYSLS